MASTESTKSQLLGVTSLAILVIGIAGWLYLQLSQVPVSVHNAREFQTASTARDFYHNGIDLFHPKLDIYPEPSYAALEFPLFQGLFAVSARWLGFDIHLGRRLALLCCLVGSLYFISSILLMGGNHWLALVGLCLYLFNLLKIRISGLAMIEPLGIMLSLMALFHGLRWLKMGRSVNVVIMAITGLLAALIKLYIFLPVMMALLAAFVHFKQKRASSFSYTLPIAIGLFWAVGLGVWWAWSRHLNHLSDVPWLVDTSALLYQQFGDLALRFNGKYFLMNVHSFLDAYLAFEWPIIVLGGFWLAREKSWLFTMVMAWLGGCLLAHGIFYQVASTHLYYIEIFLFPLAILAARGWLGLVQSGLRLIKMEKWQRAGVIALFTITLALGAIKLHVLKEWRMARTHQNEEALGKAAQFIKSVTRPDEVLALISHRPFFPEIPYLAKRRAYALTFASDLEDPYCKYHTYPANISLRCLEILRKKGVINAFVIFQDSHYDPSPKDFDQITQQYPWILGQELDLSSPSIKVRHYRFDWPSPETGVRNKPI